MVYIIINQEEFNSAEKTYEFGCLYCKKTFKGKGGFDRCCTHMHKEHEKDIQAQQMTYPINLCKIKLKEGWYSFMAVI